MNAFRRIVIVDDGDRALDSALSAQLAELGYASITTSLEATDEVLALVPDPTAIVLQVPRGADAAERARFQTLAQRLRARRAQPGVPVFMVDPSSKQGASAGFAALLDSQVGVPALANPDR